MKKKLGQLGIILSVVIIFTGCQKDDDIPVTPNEDNIAQLIDYDQAQQILNAELTNLKTIESDISTPQLKNSTTREHHCNLFKVVEWYDEIDPCTPYLLLDAYSKQNIDDNNPNIQFYVQTWFYRDGEWDLKGSYLAGGEITIGEHMAHWSETWYDYDFVATQVIIYTYINGQAPVYSGITEGVNWHFKYAPDCPYN